MKKLKKFLTIDGAEWGAVTNFAFSGEPLSGYIGSDPRGGVNVQRLEAFWADTFEVEYTVAVNSATSGLLAACMAAGVTYGDEVIVSPYTMSATAAVPLHLGARPIWADITREDFGLDPVDVSNKITRKTRAVIVTNLFGHPAHLHELRDICNAHGIWLIEDNAQAIFAREQNILCGTIGHMGVFSLNIHKQLQTGEGGVVVCHDGILDKKLREAMNHGEMRGGIIGLNLRMTEITAVMAIEQLKKAEDILKSRSQIWHSISEEVERQGLSVTIPAIRTQCYHTCYAWAGISQKELPEKLPWPWRKGYMKPLYALPAFSSAKTAGPSCSTTEQVNEALVLFEVCAYDPTNDEIKQMVRELGEAIG